MKRLRHLGFALWLALALVAGQQAAALHALAHANSEIASQLDGAPVDRSCDDHFLFTGFSGAMAAAPPAAPLTVAEEAHVSFLIERSALIAPRYAFHSRAPPASLA